MSAVLATIAPISDLIALGWRLKRTLFPTLLAALTLPLAVAYLV
jgi:hypothetical protein